MALLGALASSSEWACLHGDGNTRQCMATAVVAYKSRSASTRRRSRTRTSRRADVLIFVGEQPVHRPPDHVAARAEQSAPVRRSSSIDPRSDRDGDGRPRSTPGASRNPRRDLALLYGLATGCSSIAAWIKKRVFIGAHTRGFEEFRRLPAAVYARKAGIRESGCPSEATIREDSPRFIAKGQRVSFWWTMGVNQRHEATRTAQAIINLALMTGNIGRPGTGANSITGQCNAMGSRLFWQHDKPRSSEDMTSPIAAHRREGRRHVLDILGCRAHPGQAHAYAYDQIVRGHRPMASIKRSLDDRHQRLRIRGFSRSRIRSRSCSKLDFFVVQDIYATTESARMLAHLVLPAAGWGEKEGDLHQQQSGALG